MKKIGLLIVTMVLGYSAFSQDATVQDIIENYCRARGEEKFAKLQSYQMEGIRVRNDVMPVFYYRTRPNMYMMKFDLGDMTAYRVYDGEIGWYTAPWRGVVNPEELQKEASEAIAGSSDFDDPLASWKAKGNNLKLIGDEQVEGKNHFVIEMELNTSGLTSLYYIDKETYLLTKIKMIRPRGEQNVVNEILYSDYRSVNGIMFPFIIEEYTNGSRVVTSEFDEVILNPFLPDDFYNMSRYIVN
jgi:hypothetical protein